MSKEKVSLDYAIDEKSLLFTKIRMFCVNFIEKEQKATIVKFLQELTQFKKEIKEIAKSKRSNRASSKSKHEGKQTKDSNRCLSKGKIEDKKLTLGPSLNFNSKFSKEPNTTKPMIPKPIVINNESALNKENTKKEAPILNSNAEYSEDNKILKETNNTQADINKLPLIIPKEPSTEEIKSDIYQQEQKDQQHKIKEQINEEHKAEKLEVEEHKTEELKAEEQKTEELKAEELKAEELKDEELKPEEYKDEELKAQEYKDEELKPEEHKGEELKPEEHKDGELKDKEHKDEITKDEEHKDEEFKELHKEEGTEQKEDTNEAKEEVKADVNIIKNEEQSSDLINEEEMPEFKNKRCMDCIDGVYEVAILECGHSVCEDCIIQYICHYFTYSRYYNYSLFCSTCEEMKAISNFIMKQRHNKINMWV